MEAHTWQLVLDAARQLSASSSDFRLADIVREVQRRDPERSRGTIQPTVQGMTRNAGAGPPSPCGKPLLRVGHGLYRLDEEAPPVERPVRAPVATGGRRQRRAEDLDRRVREVIQSFEACIDAYDRHVPFGRSGQYESHRAVIDRRRQHPDVRAALEDDGLLKGLHSTLQYWGIGKRGSRLAPVNRFRDRLRDCGDGIAKFEGRSLEDPDLDVGATAAGLWLLIKGLGVVENKSLIVAGTKTLHHLLPDLVPPMDRAWTGRFFAWSVAAPQYGQERIFTQAFTRFAEIARATQPSQYVGSRWRTCQSKLVDNAVIGYCKMHGMEPAGP